MEQAVRPPLSAGRLALRFAALGLIAFYASTAHLTRGHEADFGKQWLAARLVASGQGKQLFDLRTQRLELDRHFDREVIDRGIWRDGLGGPTYPPPLALLFAPLGWLSPRWAAWALVQLSLLAIVAVSFILQRLTNHRILWEAAAIAILTMPSFFLAIGVGQNSAFSLLILTGGIALAAAGHGFTAGLVWGLFAYKPTLGLAVCWLPALLGRPRIYFGMAASSLTLVALTLPVCGIDSWFDWIGVARKTELFYQSLPRWTALSRDLPGLVRRAYDGPLVELTGWATVLAVAGLTALACRPHTRHRNFAQSPAIVTLLAGSVLSCPRFMFYDMTLAALPVLLAFAQWRTIGRECRWILVAIAATLWIGTGYSYIAWSMLGPPLDTLALAVLWAGAWLWLYARKLQNYPFCPDGLAAGPFTRRTTRAM